MFYAPYKPGDRVLVEYQVDRVMVTRGPYLIIDVCPDNRSGFHYEAAELTKKGAMHARRAPHWLFVRYYGVRVEEGYCGWGEDSFNTQGIDQLLQELNSLAARAGGQEQTPAAGAPDFSEEFKGTSLNSTVWNTRDQGYIGTRGCSKADPRAVRVSGGTLRLSTLKDPDRTAQKCNYKGKKYSYRITGHVGTVTPNLGAGQTPTKSYKYGYFAARMKMHSARGQHAGFWLQTTKSAGAARTHGSEVDIVEYFGDKHPEGGVASYIYPPGKKIGGMIPSVTQYGRDWSKRYHVFSLQWTPSVYIFRIDGKETLRITKNVSQVPEFMILSNLVSDWELPLGSESKLPQTAQVDWVRHWKL